MFVCPACRNVYAIRSSLRRHVTKCHPLQVDKFVPKQRKGHGVGLHLCDLCKKKFVQMSTLRRHQRDHHPELSGEIHNVKPVSKCSICDFTSQTKKCIIEHIQSAHGINIEYEDKMFPTFTDFLLWKEETEKNTNSSYITIMGARRCLDGRMIYSFQCNRSGYYIPKGAGLRQLKTQGSSKLNGLCPAGMKVTLLMDGKCHIHFISTHVGHQCELNHLRIQKKDREMLASKIAASIHPDTILKDVHGSISVDTSDRLRLIGKKDLQNIGRAYKLAYNVAKHQNKRTNKLSRQKENSSINLETKKHSLITQVSEIINSAQTEEEAQVIEKHIMSMRATVTELDKTVLQT